MKKTTRKKHNQCKRSSAKKATQEKHNQEKIELMFLLYIFLLTLKNTSTSVANGFYLGTLKCHMTLRTEIKFYERTCQILLKKNLIIINFHSCENLRSVLTLIFTCNDANQFSLRESGGEPSQKSDDDLRTTQHMFNATIIRHYIF